MIPPMYGRDRLRRTLVRAATGAELPGSLLLHGPSGVGKQRLGLWLAQLLLCEAPEPESGACESCISCKLVTRLEHPDLHWFFPLPRPKGVTGTDRLADALEESRAEALAVRRENPWLQSDSGGEPVGIFLAQVQTIRRLAQPRPAMGRHKVFLIADAEHLVPQESSPEAANALLKLLEEPPPLTTFIITASGPNALLSTIHSRLLPIRVSPMREDELMEILTRIQGINQDDARSVARLAQGAIGRALGFLQRNGEPGPLESRRVEARRLLELVSQRSVIGRLRAAHDISPTGARGGFSEVLSELTTWIRDLGAVANGADELVTNHDALTFLNEVNEQLPGAANNTPEAIIAVQEALELAQGNVNPQLTLTWLLRELRQILTRRDPSGAPD